MENMFNVADRVAIERRFAALQPDSPRQWGSMTPAQMLAHCAVALETPLGQREETQSLLGRVITPFIRSSIFGEAPLRRNTPADGWSVITDEREFAAERRRILAALALFCERGPAGADQRSHSFFGRLSGPEWGRFVYKHLDHHLRQFGG